MRDCSRANFDYSEGLVVGMSYFAWVGAYLVQCLVQWSMLYRRELITKHFGQYILRSATTFGVSVEDKISTVRQNF